MVASIGRNDAPTGNGQPGSASLQPFVFALFFIFGGITSLNDVLIPKLKALFVLNNAEALLVQTAFFAAYFLVSLPASIIAGRLGYLRAAVVGLLTMTAGCLLFAPAAYGGRFGGFLAALFVLAAGISIVQVVANPLISLLGRAETASSRLTFAQAFNSLGTTLFPHFGAVLILGGLPLDNGAAPAPAAAVGSRTVQASVIVHAYFALAVILAIVALMVWLQRNRLRHGRGATASPLAAFSLLRDPRFALGTLSIFLYVGAEVTIGSIMVIYLEQRDTLALPQLAAGKLVAWYWGGAMLGRFVGAGLLKLVAPGRALAGVATGAIVLLAVSAASHGAVSGYTLVAVELCNAIMFPTIFSLASAGLGQRSAEGSGIMCMAIVGGAILPPLAGAIADAASLRVALVLPALAYLFIAAFGLWRARDWRAPDLDPDDDAPALL